MDAHEDSPVSTPLLALSVVLGLVFPIAGAIIAVLMLARGRIGPGAIVAVASAVGLALGLAFVY
jgi:hypothetical protein